jgi:hypothetical protein
MKLILHHFWKDVRLMRWLLGLWLLMLVIEAVFAFLSAQPDHLVAEASRGFDNTSNIFYMAGNITWVLLVVRLVQSEPVRGTTSFWRTRPIPPLVLAISKTAFIVVLAILPSLFVRWLDFLLFNVQADAVREMMTSLIGADVLMLIILVWLAAQTRSLLQFWAVICALGLAGIVYQMLTFTNHFASGGMAPRGGLDLSTMSVLLIWGGLIVSLVVQYGFRRSREAFLIGVAGVALGLLAAISGSPSNTVKSGEPASRPDQAVTRVTYQMDPHALMQWGESNNNGTRYESASVVLLSPGSQPQGSPQPTSIDWSFQPDGGAKIRMESLEPSVRMSNSIHWTALQQANPGLTVVPSSPASNVQMYSFRTSPEKAQELKGKTGTLHLAIHGQFLNLTRCAEIPLSGSKFACIPNFRVQVSDVVQEINGSLRLEINSTGYSRSSLGLPTNIQFLLVDPRIQVGIVPEPMGGGSSSATLTGLGNWNRIAEIKTIGFNLTSLPAAIKDKIRDNKINDWVLYIYNVTPGAEFESEVNAPKTKL